MADVKKSRSGIRIKSSERKKSANKAEKGNRRNSLEVSSLSISIYKAIGNIYFVLWAIFRS
jgi:hypothetical protein